MYGDFLTREDYQNNEYKSEKLLVCNHMHNPNVPYKVGYEGLSEKGLRQLMQCYVQLGLRVSTTVKDSTFEDINRPLRE